MLCVYAVWTHSNPPISLLYPYLPLLYPYLPLPYPYPTPTYICIGRRAHVVCGGQVPVPPQHQQRGQQRGHGQRHRGGQGAGKALLSLVLPWLAVLPCLVLPCLVLPCLVLPCLVVLPWLALALIY
jgi:hypothetical protein